MEIASQANKKKTALSAGEDGRGEGVGGKLQNRSQKRGGGAYPRTKPSTQKSRTPGGGENNKGKKRRAKGDVSGVFWLY